MKDIMHVVDIMESPLVVTKCTLNSSLMISLFDESSLGVLNTELSVLAIAIACTTNLE